jgi:hypothetical protein
MSTISAMIGAKVKTSSTRGLEGEFFVVVSADWACAANPYRDESGASIVAAARPLRSLLFALHASAAAAQHAVAITIDDLPRGGDGGPRDFAAVRELNERLLASFRDSGSGDRIRERGPRRLRPAGLREVLDLWLDAGADLGNHSYSHLNINRFRSPTTPPTSRAASRSSERHSQHADASSGTSAIRTCSPGQRPKSKRACSGSSTTVGTPSRP